jgi:hypothetical protein
VQAVFSHTAFRVPALARLRSPQVGVTVDVYHLWWDPSIEREIARCGRLGALFAYHVCDWRTPTIDMLNDHGLIQSVATRIRATATRLIFTKEDQESVRTGTAVGPQSSGAGPEFFGTGTVCGATRRSAS